MMMTMNDLPGILSVDNLHRQATRMKKFFNRGQRDTMAISAHDEYDICSRGFGKSEGIDARFIIRNVWSMPGSMGALVSPTYSKAWANTLPAICHALKSWGYLPDVHYFVGRKAPASAGFALPKRMPLRDAWSNCIHFWNGTILVILSFQNGMSANSMSLDWVIGPEAKFLDYDKIKSEVIPANRGNRQYFDYSPWHHSVLYTSDMPTSKRGKWILEKEKEMDPDHIQYIRNLYSKIKRMEKEPETAYRKAEIRRLREDLALARRYQIPVQKQKGKKLEYTVLYAEYDIFDNLEIVGEDFIWQMKRDTPDLIWRTAFLNQRIFKIANGFYSALDEDIHFYTPRDSGRLSALGSDFDKLEKSGCLGDGDLLFDEPLYIAFDSNAAISTLCVGQKDGKTMKTIKSFFVKTPLKLPDLVQQFCDYYRGKLDKRVVFYFDHTFTWESGNNSESYADSIIKVLESNHWDVEDVYVGQAPKHDWKHLQIDRALKGDPDYLFPMFNAYNNEFLKLALEQAGVRQGRNGFEKDKSVEATADSPDNPDEQKTHVTDAWDTLWYGMNFYPSIGLSRSSGSGYVGFLGEKA